jgi:glucan-binding YG repeat protein
MPEEPEVDLDRVHETIHEEAHHSPDTFLKRIALTTALIAALAAVASLQAGATANEALVLKTEAARIQAEASDQWAYYQAKGIKMAIAEAQEAVWIALSKTPPPALEQKAKQYAQEQASIREEALKKEKERDQKSAEADRLLERHHRYANSVALFQVAIALGAVAALTRIRPVWFGSTLVGLAGLGLFLFAAMA